MENHFQQALDLCRFMTRHVHLAICSRKSWDTFFQLSKDAIVEINFWKLNCMFLPFKTVLKEYVLPKRIIYTDASDHAGDGYCLQILQRLFIEGGQRKTLGEAQLGENSKLWN